MREVGVYPYRSATGELLFEVVRYEPKTFRQRRPDGKGGFRWDLGDVERVLYRLPELLGADGDDWVLVPEGEKQVETLRASGFVATCNPMGAGKWHREYSEALRGRRVAVFPDNDGPGRLHAADIVRSIEESAADVRVVELPHLPEKGDVSDWLEAGNSPDDLPGLIDAAPNGKFWSGAGVPEASPCPTFRTLADIDDSAPGPLRLGMFEDGPNLAYGPPGTGKGTTAAWIIVEEQKLGRKVAIFDAERRPREWSRRVGGLGGDRSQVIYMTPEDLGPHLAGQPIWEVAPAIGPVLRFKGVGLLIVDSIVAAVGVGDERLRSDAQTPFLYVAALDALGIPSISLGHPPKGQSEGEPFGSMAWTAAMRLTWLGTKVEGISHSVRWRPRKRNERGHIPGVLLTFIYGDDGRPCDVVREDDEQATRDWLLQALATERRSVLSLAEESLDGEDTVTPQRLAAEKQRLGKALNRLKHAGLVRPDKAGGAAVKWGLIEHG